MSIKITTKVDISAFKELKSQLEKTKVDVGWIDTPTHWMASLMNHDFSVGALASHLHYHSAWEDTFMLSETRRHEITNTVNSVLSTGFGRIPFKILAGKIGAELEEDVKENIEKVSSPPNSEGWASVKGFNDPLVFGSRVGQTPNLVSELTHKVR